MGKELGTNNNSNDNSGKLLPLDIFDRFFSKYFYIKDFTIKSIDNYSVKIDINIFKITEEEYNNSYKEYLNRDLEHFCLELGRSLYVHINLEKTLLNRVKDKLNFLKVKKGNNNKKNKNSKEEGEVNNYTLFNSSNKKSK